MRFVLLLLSIAFIVPLSHSLEAQTPLYLNFISHNEVSDTFDYENAGSDYWLVTNIARQVADTVEAKQAKWDIQVDANYLIGSLNHDNAASSSSDFLEWAHNSSYIDVGPHNHFDTSNVLNPNYNPYNYTDLVYLLDSCGITPAAQVIGGFTWQAADGENWTQHQNAVPGNVFTGFSWQADVLWGAASPGHTNDVDDFGVWKPNGPASLLTFRQHNPSNHLLYIGGGCKEETSFVILPSTGALRNSTAEIIASIRNIADQINGLPPAANEFYTTNMLLNFRDMPVIPGFADSIAAIIDGLAPYVAAGKIVWATLAEKQSLWLNAHSDPGDSFNFACAGIPAALAVPEPGEVQVFPNPSAGVFSVNSPQAMERIEVFGMDGRQVLTVAGAGRRAVEVRTDLSRGLYLLRIVTEEGEVCRRLWLRSGD